MTTRRQLVFAGALSAFSARNGAAQARVARIGMLAGVPRDQSALTRPLVRALADLGYREGGAMILDYRYSHEHRDLPRIARELVTAKCDVIFAFASEPAARALRDTGTSIPVVFISTLYDPVQAGIIASFGRPGGNMTGIHMPVALLVAKRIELAQEILPSAHRFLIFTDPDTRDQLSGTKAAAAARGVELTVVEFTGSSYDLRAAFETGIRAGVDGFLPFSSAGFQLRRAELSELILQYRLPTIGPGPMAGDPGILVSYHPDIPRQVRRAAEIAVRILKGAKPADIPVEQPDAYELQVNLKLAKRLGLKIPYSVMARATKVIE